MAALQALATDEKIDPPAHMPPRPSWLDGLPNADPDLAYKSLEQVSAALSPLRDHAEQIAPLPPSETILAARAAMARQEPDAAIRLLADHVRRIPADTAAWRELARFLDVVSRRDLAGEAWGRVLAEMPFDAEALAAGGIDAAATRQSLLAAERLLRLRQIQRVGETPTPEPAAAIAQAAALGLSLREIGHLQAAAECLMEAANGSMKMQGIEAAAIRRQAGELQRIAGECLMAVGQYESACTSLRVACAEAGPEDRVALPRFVWALCSAGKPMTAAFELAHVLQHPSAAARTGAPAAAMVLAHCTDDSWLQCLAPAPCDVVAQRIRLKQTSDHASACGDTPIESLLQGGQRPDLASVCSMVAEREGLSKAIDLAWHWCQQHPWQSADMAWALRCMPASAEAIRRALNERVALKSTDQTAPANGRAETEAAWLVLAQFELQGGDAESAFAISNREGIPAEFREPFLAVAAEAAASMEDLAKVTKVSLSEPQSAELCATLAECFAALGAGEQADRFAEAAIQKNDHLPLAWIGRSQADLVSAAEDSRDRMEQDRINLDEARLSAERAWECNPNRFEGARRFLELTPPGRTNLGELRQLLRADPLADASLRELCRFEALQRVRQGQADPAQETLRALLVEDPMDHEVAAALVIASAASNSLVQLEAWLEVMTVRRPAAPALLEALVSAKARQGRLAEAVEDLRRASAADPTSAARTRALARGLVLEGRMEEGWQAMAALDSLESGPRATLERAECALRAGRTTAAAEILKQVSQCQTLTASQRSTALVVALSLPRESPQRRELLASLGQAALTSPDAGPAVVAAAMLGGEDAQAQTIAAQHAQPWDAAATMEAAQLLVDEGLLRRARSLLTLARGVAAPQEHRSLMRAEIALCAAMDDADFAEKLLNEALNKGEAPLLPEENSSHLARNISQALQLNELAGCFMLADFDSTAEKLFEQAIALDPTLGEALNNLAWLRIARGQLDAQTSGLVQRAIAARPNDTSTLDTAGWWSYLHEAEDPDLSKAVSQLKHATQGNAPSLESLDHLADALWQSGLHEDAARTWRRVVEAGTGTGLRDRSIQAFDGMQQRLWGIRAWNAASFYDARDGAAISRAQSKLKALSESQTPVLTPRVPPPTATPPSFTSPPTPSQQTP